MIDSHLVWSPAVLTMAYFGHRIAIVWLEQRERKCVRDEQRDERDNGALSKLEEMDTRLKAMKLHMDTFIANNGQRR